MVGMRDRLIHGYDDIDLAVARKVVTEEVSLLRQQLEAGTAGEPKVGE